MHRIDIHNICECPRIRQRRQWHPTPALLLGKSRGQRSLVGCRSGHDWVTLLSIFTFHFHVLEKEMATHSSVLAWKIPGTEEPGRLPSVYGVAQSQTRLKQLSSSSSSSSNDWWFSAYIHALLATRTYSLEKSWFKSFVLLLLSFILELCPLYILDTNSLLYMYFADTVSYYVFLIWWCSLKQRKFLI